MRNQLWKGKVITPPKINDWNPQSWQSWWFGSMCFLFQGWHFRVQKPWISPGVLAAGVFYEGKSPNFLDPLIQVFWSRKQPWRLTFRTCVSLSKALLNPYFWGGYVTGGWLTSHDFRVCKICLSSTKLHPSGLFHPPFVKEKPPHSWWFSSIYTHLEPRNGATGYSFGWFHLIIPKYPQNRRHRQNCLGFFQPVQLYEHIFVSNPETNRWFCS